jgi:EmrB/QacA subfamily drug resistance transporter
MQPTTDSSTPAPGPAESQACSRAITAPSPRLLVSLSLSMLMPSLDTSIANAGLPVFAAAFHASFRHVQWIVLAYLLAITTLIVSVGRLGDLIGARRLLLAGIALFTGASLLCGIAPTLGLLIAARAAQGFGAAIMLALTIAFVGQSVPTAKTGSVMGLLGSMSAIGTTLGPSLGGVLIATMGWQSVFLVNVPLGVVSLFLAYRHLPADARASSAERERFDTLGTVLLGLTLAAYALALTIGRGQFGVLNVELLFAGALSAALFVIVESRTAAPLVRLAMFRDRVLSSSLVMSALVSTVIMTTLVVGPFYLSRSLGLDTMIVGLALSVGPLVAALTGVPAGRIVDRFGARPMSLAGLAGIASGAFALSLAPTSFGLAGYLTPIALITASYALFQTANNTVVITGTGSSQRGLVSGLLSLSRNLGLITGASAMGAVFAIGAATTDITTARPDAVASGMRMTFAVSALVIVGAIGLTFAVAAAGTVTRRARIPETA